MRHRLPLLICLGLLAVAAPAQAASAPGATTGSVRSITATSAEATGFVNPNGLSTTFFFRFGTSRSYGQVSAVNTTSGKPIGVRIPLVGLTPHTTYHVQLVAENSAGTTFGADRRFQTKSQPLSVILATRPNPVSYGAGVTIAGALTGTGAGHVPVVLQANPFPYTGGFRSVAAFDTTALGQFSFVQAPGVNTQYRVVATGHNNTVTATTTVGVAARFVTLHVIRAHNRRRLTTVYGSVLPAHAGSPVLLTRLLGGGRFRVVALTLLRGGGPGGRASGFRFVVRVHQGGRFGLQVLPSDGSNLPGLSGTFRLRSS